MPPFEQEVLLRLGRLEGRFDGIDTRFDGVDSRLDRVELAIIHDNDRYMTKNELHNEIDRATAVKIALLESHMKTNIDRRSIIGGLGILISMVLSILGIKPVS
mgnify:FL=1